METEQAANQEPASVAPLFPALSAVLDAPPRLGRDEAAALARRFETQSPQALLQWALQRWGKGLSLVTSFQAEGMVLLDMAWRIDPEIRVVTLDTGRLPHETYEQIDRVRRRYGVDVEVYYPDADLLQALVRRRGPNLFYRSVEDRLACCRVRKVEPLSRALDCAEAWLTGLRRDQAPSRAQTAKIALDDKHGGIVKLSPLADWSSERVWAYIEEHDVPRHALYTKGFTSIGCAPCTRAVVAGEDPRAGRWWWEAGTAKECGLHLPASAPTNDSTGPLVSLGGGKGSLRSTGGEG